MSNHYVGRISRCELMKADAVLFYSVQYCHYVAGLVGVGLSQLFSASKLEDPEVGRDTELANSMGLFLQKTNIIRDYLEDTQQGRAFWPQEVNAWCGLFVLAVRLTRAPQLCRTIVKESAAECFSGLNALKPQYLLTFYQQNMESLHTGFFCSKDSCVADS